MPENYKNIAIKNFTYDLPDERIAKFPLKQRDASKLLYLEQGKIKHTVFKNLSQLLKKDDALIFNNAKVIQARLNFRKTTGAKIEVFCLEPHNPADYNLAFQSDSSCRWKCMVGNLKKWKTGILTMPVKINKVECFLSAEKLEQNGNVVIVNFTWQTKNNERLTFGDILEYAGKTPLPPYLNREAQPQDKETYQTVYAKKEGSVAAPTAGLHFTDNVFKQLEACGINTYELTLHVGAGTFRPVKSETIEGHDMHEEHFMVEKSFLKEMISIKGRKLAVGTTSVRTLESLYWLGVKVSENPLSELFVSQWEVYEPGAKLSFKESMQALVEYLDRAGTDYLQAVTQIIIVPGYRFRVVDGLITNFHQPQSTLLLLIAAVIGNKWKEVYEYALKNGFRFLSYGDSSLFFVEEEKNNFAKV